MKVAITGHTKGIGKAFSEVFPDYIGFSRSNGYDITNPEIRTRIIQESMDCQIFVNNAQQEFAQTELLMDLWDKWKFRPKIIVNIGSRSSDYLDSSYTHYRYALQKKTLENASLYMSKGKYVCKVTYVKAGYVDTDSVTNVQDKKIDARDLAQQVKEIISIDKGYWIPMIALQARNI